MSETETITFFDVRAGDDVSFDGGRTWSRVWSIADNLGNGRRTGIRFVERDPDTGRRLYAVQPNTVQLTRRKR